MRCQRIFNAVGHRSKVSLQQSRQQLSNKQHRFIHSSSTQTEHSYHNNDNSSVGIQQRKVDNFDKWDGRTIAVVGLMTLMSLASDDDYMMEQDIQYNSFVFSVSKAIYEEDLDKAQIIVSQYSGTQLESDTLKYIIMASAKDQKALYRVMKYFNLSVTNDEDWSSVLQMCCSRSLYCNKRVLVPWILKTKKIDINSELSEELLSNTIHNYDAISLNALIQYGLKPNINHLDQALEHGPLMTDIVQILLDQGKVIPSGNQLMKVVTTREEKIQMKAAKQSYTALVQMLIDHGADVNYMNQNCQFADDYCTDKTIRRMITNARSSK
jgi:hypothetical protein